MSKIVETIAGPFTNERATKLARFLKTCDPKQDTVIFENQQCDLKFLRYLLQYLQTHFPNLK